MRAGALAQLLRVVAGQLRRCCVAYITLNKSTGKLGYVATALLTGVVEEGFCIAPQADDDNADRPDGANFKETDGMVCVWLSPCPFMPK